MSSDDSMNNGVGFEQLDSLSASADGGIPIEYDDELFVSQRCIIVISLVLS